MRYVFLRWDRRFDLACLRVRPPKNDESHPDDFGAAAADAAAEATSAAASRLNLSSSPSLKLRAFSSSDLTAAVDATGKL